MFKRTDKQSAASRANAQKSTGPRTTAGKANSRFNALKHGIDARQQIVFTESAEYHELHNPANADERFLVDTLVNNEWRLQRIINSCERNYRNARKELHAAQAARARSVCGDRANRITPPAPNKTARQSP